MRGDFETEEGECAGWADAMSATLGDYLETAEFDMRFIRYLVALLDKTGFPNLSFAILRSAQDVKQRSVDREEFDGLVDLGIQVMSRDGRRLSQEW
jgi:hypothetical protein